MQILKINLREYSDDRGVQVTLVMGSSFLNTKEKIWDVSFLVTEEQNKCWNSHLLITTTLSVSFSQLNKKVFESSSNSLKQE
jgi:hypothetical protein